MLLHYIANKTCSHCRAHTSHYVIHAVPETEKIESENEEVTWKETGERIRAFTYCGHCSQPSMFVLVPRESRSNVHSSLHVNRDPRVQMGFLNRLRPLYDLVNPNASLVDPGAASSRYYAIPSDESACVLNASYKVEAQYPSCDIEQPEAEFLPPGIALDLSELLQIQHSSPRWTVAACRRILEKACKEALKENTEKKPLYDLIEAALNNLETTQQISKWAHTLRVLGNEAVHKSDKAITAKEAQQSCDLTRLLLDLLFVYPEKIKKLRNSKDD